MGQGNQFQTFCFFFKTLYQVKPRVLGQLPPRKMPPPLNPKTNSNPNPNPNRGQLYSWQLSDCSQPQKITLTLTQTLTLTGGQYSSGGNCPDTKSKWSAAQFHIFRQPSYQHTLETDRLKLYSIDPEICSILISIFKLNFYFHTSLWYLKMFYEGL